MLGPVASRLCLHLISGPCSRCLSLWEAHRSQSEIIRGGHELMRLWLHSGVPLASEGLFSVLGYLTTYFTVLW